MATAQCQVSVGVGLVAGSIVMLLTVIWGPCVIVGKRDLQDSRAINRITTRRNVTGYGVSTDKWTSFATMIMAVSVILFMVVQIPQSFISSSSGKRVVVLISIILTLALLLSYCIYQGVLLTTLWKTMALCRLVSEIAQVTFCRV